MSRWTSSVTCRSPSRAVTRSSVKSRRRDGDRLSRAECKHDRDVALKVLDPALGAVLGVERFLSEIRVTARLQHPNLLPLFDRVKPTASCTMYAVRPRGDPAHETRAGTPVPVDEAVQSRAIASALEYAHRTASSTAISSRPTCSCTRATIVADFGIARPYRTPAGTESRKRDCRSARRHTCRPSRRPATADRRAQRRLLAGAVSTKC